MNSHELTQYFENHIEQFLKTMGEEAHIIQRNIGAGAFGTVHVMEEKIGDESLISALKVQLIAEEGYTEQQKQDYIDLQRQNFQNEVTIMQQLQLTGCPNIVEYRSHVIRPVVINKKTEGYICLLKMELLSPFLSTIQNQKLTEKNVIKIAMDIGTGIQSAHAKGIIHRDIKPENFFVSDDGIYKLGDFNVSKRAETARTFAGAHGYIAPEIYRSKANPGELYTHQADLYSFGICLYQFMNDMYFPFEQEYGDADIALDMRMSGEYLLPNPKNASEEFSRIILKACAFQTNERYQTIDELLAQLKQMTSGASMKTLPKQEKTFPTVYAGDESIHQTSVSPAPVRNGGADKQSRMQTIIMIFVILFLLLCVVALVFLLLKDKSGSELETAEHETDVTDALEEVATQTLIRSRTGNDSEQEAVSSYQTICEVCGALISLTDEMMSSGTVVCPECGTELEFVFEDDTAEAPAIVNTEELQQPEVAVAIPVTEPQIIPETEPQIIPETEPVVEKVHIDIPIPPVEEPAPVAVPEPAPEPVQIPAEVEIPEEVVDVSPSFSSAYASSILSDTTSHTYQAYKAVDGDLTTCWAEGAGGAGIGESLTLYADRKQRLNSIVIYNGLCTDEELFYKNGRIKECRIEFSNQNYLDVTLTEDYWSQPCVINFDTIDTDYIRFTILSTYSGNKYDDTCISEISVRNN
ncbi:MAG: protein kinase [Oscillospiraceae bacterium]